MQTALDKCETGKAPGPDKVHNEILKQLGIEERHKLLKLINRTWTTGILPKQWKKATIIPIQKEGKPGDRPDSYRPISLTSCLGKIAERMVNARLYWFLEKNKCIPVTQGGFRKGRQPMDQVVRIVQTITNELQLRNHTLAVFFDLKQAYDKVWRTGLMYKLQQLGITAKMHAWIHSFLENRTIRTRMGDSISSEARLQDGLPQGSALSCTLFLAYVCDIQTSIECQSAMFADDLVVLTSGKDVANLQHRLQRDLDKIEAYAKKWRLIVNTEKTVHSIFTNGRNALKHDVVLNICGKRLNWDKTPTYLGVRLDQKLQMHNHIRELRAKTSAQLSLVKKLASTNWGADARTLRALYLSKVRSAIDYSLPIQAFASRTALEDLDRVQNQALRLVCGALRTTPNAAVEILSNVEPLKVRREKAILTTVERYRRMDRNEPCFQIQDRWVKRSRLKRPSFMDAVNELEVSVNLPKSREKMSMVPARGPHECFSPPDLRLTLANAAVRKNSPVELQHEEALRTINAYGTGVLRVYADGSCFTDGRSGYGALIEYPAGGGTNSS